MARPDARVLLDGPARDRRRRRRRLLVRESGRAGAEERGQAPPESAPTPGRRPVAQERVGLAATRDGVGYDLRDPDVGIGV